MGNNWHTWCRVHCVVLQQNYFWRVSIEAQCTNKRLLLISDLWGPLIGCTQCAYEGLSGSPTTTRADEHAFTKSPGKSAGAWTSKPTTCTLRSGIHPLQQQTHRGATTIIIVLLVLCFTMSPDTRSNELSALLLLNTVFESEAANCGIRETRSNRRSWEDKAWLEGRKALPVI